MQNLKAVLFLSVSFVLLSLYGCGSGSSGTTSAKDPLAGVVGDAQNSSATSGTLGNIMFTDKAGLAPGSQSNMLLPWAKENVDPTTTPSVVVLQLLPFKVTDSNGNTE